MDELKESSMLAATIAWDNALSWTWEKAINSLEAMINQVYLHLNDLTNDTSRTTDYLFSQHV